MQIRSIAIAVLQDSKVYLESIHHAVYCADQKVLLGASIGKHTRHFIEYFQCLLDQIQDPHPVICYAKRKRDLRIESDPDCALKTIQLISSRIEGLHHDRACQMDYSEHNPNAGDANTPSSLERELLYNIDHTIHHLALIRIGLEAIAPEIELPDSFGYMPSTLHVQAACAQ